MDRQEMIDKVANFVFPSHVAFVSILFEKLHDANMFCGVCNSLGYKTTYYRTKGDHEIRFSSFGSSFIDPVNGNEL